MQRIDILKEIQDARSIAITGHIRPDGDCIGSVMSLYHYIKNARKDLEPDIYLEEPSFVFDYIKDIKKIRYEAGEPAVYDVLFVCDTSADRIGHALGLFEKAVKTINIDHHISNAEGSAMVNFVEPEVGSCCEVLYHLMDRTYMDTDIAKELYTGIIHDTGVMQYSNTTPDTLRICADLISFGFDFTRLIDESFYEKTYRQNLLLGRALEESRLCLDGRAIVSVVTLETMKFYGATPKTVDGIVNQLRRTRGTYVAIFMYELEEGQFKVSLRSDEHVNVSLIAQSFGGGGHIRAAGFNVEGDPEEHIRRILDEILKQL